MNDESVAVTDSENEAAEQPVFLGPRLREAREAKGLTIEEVAKQLKLKRAFITALEADDFGALPSVLFARGYLKSYAKLLGIPGVEVTSAFDHLGLTEVVPVPHGAILTSKRHRRGEHLVLKWGSAAVVLVTITLLVVWFQGISTSELMAKLGFSKPSAEVTSALAPPLPAEASGNGEQAASAMSAPPEAETALPLEREEASVSEPAKTDAPIAITSPPPPPVEQEPTAISETTIPEAAPAGPVTEIAETERAPEATAIETPSETTAPTSTDSAPVAERVEVPVVSSGYDTDSLELTLQADSWTEVTDASGYKLIYRLLRAGEVHRVTGQAPFSIFLGNAPAVQLRFNDEPVTDIRPNSKGVARFTLGST